MPLRNPSTPSDSHAEAHTVASHSDTTATGAETETLTDGSDASALHVHTVVSLDTTATGAELTTLTDASETALHSHAGGSATMEGPMIPDYPGARMTGNTAVATNTVMGLALVSVPHKIAVSEISIAVGTVTTPGTLGLAVFSNDGQTRHINITTASISASNSQVTTSLGGDVTLDPGLYYFAINPDGSASMTVYLWAGAYSNFSDSGFTSTAGLNELSGSIAVSAGAMATTFDPSAMTVLTTAGPAMRFN